MAEIIEICYQMMMQAVPAVLGFLISFSLHTINLIFVGALK